MVFPDSAVFPQITELVVNYPEEGTPPYADWTDKLAKMFPNVNNHHLNEARLAI